MFEKFEFPSHNFKTPRQHEKEGLWEHECFSWILEPIWNLTKKKG